MTSPFRFGSDELFNQKVIVFMVGALLCQMSTIAVRKFD